MLVGFVSLATGSGSPRDAHAVGRPATRFEESKNLLSGFTLIEVVVVVVIVALLAGLVAPNVFRNLGVARESTARSQAAMLAAALDAYRLDNGRYPSEEQGLQALWTAPTAAPIPGNWAGPYLRRSPPLDPWDRPYIYRLDEVGRFNILTYGSDGVEGGVGEEADVVLW